MPPYRTFFWKKNPFIRLLLPFASGIIIQHYFQPGLPIWLISSLIMLSLLLLSGFLSLSQRMKYGFLAGVLISLLLISAGGVIAVLKDIRNDKNWFGSLYKQGDMLQVTLLEPPSEKARTYKAVASVDYIIRDGQPTRTEGKLILYFSKDSSFNLQYGSQLLLNQGPEPVKNPGNPGSFNYRRYCLFQGITHQVFLKDSAYELLPGMKARPFKRFLFAARKSIINTIRENIPGEKEASLAEALLIGYKDDLDQSLVQSYTNTGVVHVIAISGLHLGLLYWLLSLLFRPLLKKRKTRWAGTLAIILLLWLFSLVAGAQPSILRSAVMFSCIIIGDSLSRKTTIFNTLALSAFILLCINPFWLWDVGFQLSYAAVLSIVVFFRPVYNLLYIKNKLLDAAWKLTAVTLAAQLLTLPISIFHFHQVPLLFLFTNFLAVPLSSIILLAELFLCSISFISPVAMFAGKITAWLIWVMNTYIEKIESLRFSLWDGLQVSFIQTIFLLAFIAFAGYWFIEKNSKAFLIALCSLLVFAVLRSQSFIDSDQQQKIIVYNVPRRSAIDFVNGRDYRFIGDSTLLYDDFARNFHLKPARVLYRLSENNNLPDFLQSGNCISFYGKRILLINETTRFLPAMPQQEIDLLVLSGNPKLYFTTLAKTFTISQVVFDGSVPAWKSRYWKKDCDSLHIQWHDVSADGAFVMNLR